MCFLRHPPSLGLCGLVSGLLTLSLGVASYLAGFISSATVAACLPPPLSTHLVEDFMSALTVHESTHLLLRTFSVQQSLCCTCILIQHSFLREQSDQLWIQWESDFRFALLSYNREFCWVSMPPSSTPQRMRWTLSIPLAEILMRVDDLQWEAANRGPVLRAGIPLEPANNPPAYDGDPNSCQAFLSQCSLVFSLQPRRYATEEAKVCFRSHSSLGPLPRMGNRRMEIAGSLLCYICGFLPGDDEAVRPFSPGRWGRGSTVSVVSEDVFCHWLCHTVSDSGGQRRQPATPWRHLESSLSDAASCHATGSAPAHAAAEPGEFNSGIVSALRQGWPLRPSVPFKSQGPPVKRKVLVGPSPCTNSPATRTQLPFRLSFQGGSHTGHALLDSGAEGNFLGDCVSLSLSGNHCEQIELFIIDSPKAPLVLGHPWLLKHNPHIDWVNNYILAWSQPCRVSCLGAAFPAVSVSCVSQADPPDLTGVPAEYCDLRAIFCKSRATSLPPHHPYDCAIDLLPGTSPPKGGYFTFPFLKERPWMGIYGKQYRLGSFAILPLPPVQVFSSFRRKTAPYTLVLTTEDWMTLL